MLGEHRISKEFFAPDIREHLENADQYVGCNAEDPNEASRFWFAEDGADSDDINIYDSLDELIKAIRAEITDPEEC